MADNIPKLPVIVIIGAGGIGMEVARRLGSGKHLVIGTRSMQSLEVAIKSLGEAGYSVEGSQVDVADKASVEKFATRAGALGPIETIVLTSGVSPATASSVKELLATNILGTAHVIDAFLPFARTSTSLICISSMTAHFKLAALSTGLERHLATSPTDKLLQHPDLRQEIGLDNAYCISKEANNVRVQGAAAAWGAKGARINTVSPGLVSTPMGEKEMSGKSGARVRAMIDGCPAHRIATPADIANTVIFLASSQASCITGNDILVDGGTAA